MSNHTPGPWTVATRGHKQFVLTDPESSPYAGQVIAIETTAPQTPANLRLIAAAPDGHEILMAIHEFFRHHNPVDPSATVLSDDRSLKEAVADYVAKATGN